MDVLLFPFATYWWFYLAFVGLVLVILALDLGVFHKDAHEIRFKEAAAWSMIWIVLAVSFSYFLYWYAQILFAGDPRLIGLDHKDLATQASLQFLTGFVVEKSLAIDNIFIFVVVFNYLAIPARYQHRVLFYGIIGALLFRAIFIALGSILMEFEWVVILFGAFLLLTGVKIFFAGEKPVDPSKSFFIKLVRRLVRITPQLHGQRFFVRENGTLFATPLFLALVFVEVSDILFAFDSVPAIFGLTKEPLIVFTSNVFAILGLRAMFFLLAGTYQKFHMLKYGLGIILVFVGLKMVWLNEAFGGKFPVGWSLTVICSVIALSVALSLLIPQRHIGLEPES